MFCTLIYTRDIIVSAETCHTTHIVAFWYGKTSITKFSGQFLPRKSCIDLFTFFRKLLDVHMFYKSLSRCPSSRRKPPPLPRSRPGNYARAVTNLVSTCSYELRDEVLREKTHFQLMAFCSRAELILILIKYYDGNK